MTAKQYQDLMLPKLRGRLDGLEVINEWSAFRGVYGQYSPRVDIAVGPFSTITDQTLINEYNRILKQEELIMFLRKVFDFHLINTQQSLLETEKIYHINSKIRKNKNARCFMAIEIENTSTKKQ